MSENEIHDSLFNLEKHDKQKSLAQVPSLTSPVCRICQASASSEQLISPCHCKGTLAYIHLSCLERWLNESSRNYCELCKFRFNAIQTQRYGLWQGLRLWVLHPRNRRHIQSDFIVGLLLTLVTAGLIAVCIYGMDYFVNEAYRIGMGKNWIRFVLVAFLFIISLGYVVSVYLLVRDHFTPWYQWWRRTVNIRLLFPCQRQ
ncbi:E3 ubiquitin-protein ligase MARCHF2-like [Rhynchophorus ferrugineus]|uniref:E3 ubiquitin-protein ligase MARCH3 n=1 Tax=Rhynchophorus ferrugineus TaxID=354439 RepID=A0A834IN83_RHYFE|nr:hypothetical protein GWI33_005306 [Rhynchophorus ferrugineus]